MTKPVLVVLAAGMGSRYGGCKQIDPVGANGEIIIDYSLYDAHRAGFEDVVFIIKSAIAEDFAAAIGERMKKHFNVSYAFQELDCLPEGYSCPEGRIKPYGTTHALLCARDAIGSRPFCVINADDYYGPESFALIYDFLSGHDDAKGSYAMSAYIMGNTLSDSGTVARGVCETDANGFLTSIVERTAIKKTANGAEYKDDNGEFHPLDADKPVSMNFWGFTADVFDGLQKDMSRFLSEEFVTNPMKSECLLPNSIGAMLRAGEASVNVLRSHDRWHGVTYREDKPAVEQAMRKLAEDGVYPSPLWTK